jgi:hypothetical protein
MKQSNVGAPFERIAFDIAGPFSITDSGNKYIMVVMDYFSKWPEASLWRCIRTKAGTSNQMCSKASANFWGTENQNDTLASPVRRNGRTLQQNHGAAFVEGG